LLGLANVSNDTLPLGDHLNQTAVDSGQIFSKFVEAHLQPFYSSDEHSESRPGNFRTDSSD
jgi:hypothetical protein